MALPLPIPSSQIILQTGNGQNYLTWPSIVGSGIYSVNRSVDGINFVFLVFTQGASYLDLAVSVGTQYWYQVQPGYYSFSVSSANATAGAIYSNNAHTYTVLQTIVAGTTLLTSFGGNSLSSGTLTLVSGSGDATISFSSTTIQTVNATPSSPASITPCLPGQINLGYLRYQAQLRSDLLNSNFITTDEWNLMINNSIMELYDLLVTKFGEDYFLAPPLVIQSTSALSYPLPNGANNLQINGIPNPAGTPAPACYKVYGVDFNSYGAQLNNTQGWVSMSRFNWADHNKYNILLGAASNNISGQYCSFQFREMGSNIYIIPTNSGQYFRLWYVPQNTQLLLDTDMMPFGYSSWWEIVAVDVAAKALSKQQFTDQASELMSRKEMLEMRIETTAANRNVGMPNTATNSRATMGDPNFSGPGGSGNGWGSGMGNGWGY